MRVIVLGAGGHAKVLLEALKLNGVEVFGLTDIAQNKNWGTMSGFNIIGNDDEILKYRDEGLFLVNGIGSIRVSPLRREAFERCKGQGYKFIQVIHPGSVVAEGVRLGEGVQIMAGAVIQPGTCIGDNSVINTLAAVDHDCEIGSHVHVSPGAVLSGGVKLGNGTHVGTGAVVIQGIQIGANCLIAAGAVVTKDIPDGAAVAGVPARQMKKR